MAACVPTTTHATPPIYIVEGHTLTQQDTRSMRLTEQRVRAAVRKSLLSKARDLDRSVLSEARDLDVSKIMDEDGFSWNGTDSIGSSAYASSASVRGERDTDDQSFELAYIERTVQRECDALRSCADAAPRSCEQQLRNALNDLEDAIGRIADARASL